MAGRAVWSYAAGGYDPQEVRANYYAFWLGAEAQSGTTREKTIESLKRRGIGEEAAFIGANDLANSIINYAVSKVARQIAEWETEGGRYTSTSVKCNTFNSPVQIIEGRRRRRRRRR
ncbi:hypothetical protein DIZ76_011515 [Coccidioides immitis]|nr:hypothetical protein DIZ76_011515 [Coccidioides immitis]